MQKITACLLVATERTFDESPKSLKVKVRAFVLSLFEVLAKVLDATQKIES